MLPYVIEYNSQIPNKFTAFPKYKYFVADKKYWEISKTLGLKADSIEEGVKNLIEEIRTLMRKLNEPTSIKECGIGEDEYFSVIEKLSLEAFDDQCTSANPRSPLISELKEIYSKIY